MRLEELRTQFADFQSKEALVVTPEQRARVAALAQDFPRLWNAPTTKAKDKKRILRLLIKDITVERFGERKIAVLHVRWQGGACEDLEVTLPANIADLPRYPDEVVDRVRELARERCDEDVAAALNQEGRRSAKGEAFNVSMVRWIRYKHRIPAPDFQRPGERSVRQVADELGVSRNVVYYCQRSFKIPPPAVIENSPTPWLQRTMRRVPVGAVGRPSAACPRRCGRVCASK